MRVLNHGNGAKRRGLRRGAQGRAAVEPMGSNLEELSRKACADQVQYSLQRAKKLKFTESSYFFFFLLSVDVCVSLPSQLHFQFLQNRNVLELHDKIPVPCIALPDLPM